MSEGFDENDLFLLEDAALQAEISDGDLTTLQDLGNRMLRLDNMLEKIAETEKKVKEARRVLCEDLIPKKMMEIGVTQLKLVTGETISMESVVAANMPKADEKPEEFKKAVRWLEDNGVGDIVKKEVITKFGRGESELAQRVFEIVQRETNGNVPIEMKEGVNYQTLNATLRSRLKSGGLMPTNDDGFSIYIGPRAKIAKPKK